MKNTSLILVRHGQSEWNEKNLFTGWENPGLTQKGEKEAKDAGKIINSLGINFDYLYLPRIVYLNVSPWRHVSGESDAGVPKLFDTLAFFL